MQKAYTSWWPQDLCMNALYWAGKSILTKSNSRYQVSIEGESNNGFTLNPYTLNFKNLNFGQTLDIHIISQQYDELCAESQQEIVLFGPSRGAAAIINLWHWNISKSLKSG